MDIHVEDSPANVIEFKPKPRSEPHDPKPDEPMLTEKSGPVTYLAREGECRHINIQVSEDLDEVDCRDCGRKLNPIWVLRRMAQQETKWSRRRAELLALSEAVDKRVRCKCEHCGEMTRIPVRK